MQQIIPRPRHRTLKGRCENPRDSPHEDKNPQPDGNAQVEVNGGQAANEDDDGEFGAAHAKDKEQVGRILGLDNRCALAGAILDGSGVRCHRPSSYCPRWSGGDGENAVHIHWRWPATLRLTAQYKKPGANTHQTESPLTSRVLCLAYQRGNAEMVIDG